MPDSEDSERDFWVGITIFGAALGTGLYALVEHEWWFGGFYTVGGGGGLMWMSPAVRSRLGLQPPRAVLAAAIAVTWVFLAANITLSIYEKWVAPVPTSSADEIAQAKAQQAAEDQKRITTLNSQLTDVEKERDEARQAMRTAQQTVPLSSSEATTRWLKLDDTEKWRFAYALRTSTVADNGERLSCPFALNLSSDEQWHYEELALGAWSELQPLLDLAWWKVSGGQAKGHPHYPPGLTILVGTDNGAMLTCASNLARILQDMKILPVSVRTNQVTADANCL